MDYLNFNLKPPRNKTPNEYPVTKPSPDKYPIIKYNTDTELKYDHLNINSNASINIKEIQKIRKNKTKIKLKIYDKILNKCYSKIRSHVQQDESFCFFNLPEYIIGYPLYNTNYCAFYIINKLKYNGIGSKFVEPNILYITWYCENIYDQINKIERKSNHQLKEKKRLSTSRRIP